MDKIERADEWTTMQAALAFGGFVDAAETGRVTVWAAEEIESLRRQLAGAVDALQFFADGGTYEDGDKVRPVPWPLQVRAREALAAIRGR